MVQTFVSQPARQLPQTGWAQVVPSQRRCWEYLLLQLEHGANGVGRVLTTNGPETLLLGGRTLEEALQILGTEEWELAAVDPSAKGTVYIFKRPL